MLVLSGMLIIEFIIGIVIVLLVAWVLFWMHSKNLERWEAITHKVDEGYKINENTAQGVKEMFTRMEEFKKHQEQNTTTREQLLGRFKENITKDLNQNMGTLTQHFSTLSDKVNKQLSEAIEKLGEFKELSKGVDSLSKILSNVKQKGKFGEYQLESIIKDLVPEPYYHREYSLTSMTKAGTDMTARVDFVIRLPSASEEKVTWLPIDSKYPQAEYEKLRVARESLREDDEKKARRELFAFIRDAAKTIKTKYIVPPETTDFAILFIPMESLFMECYQDSTFIDDIRREYNIMITGPNHFYVLLHMLQMGYTKMEIEKKSQELWQILTLFQEGMHGVVKSLAEAEKKVGKVHEELGRTHRKAARLEQNIKTKTLDHNATAPLPEAHNPKELAVVPTDNTPTSSHINTTRTEIADNDFAVKATAESIVSEPAGTERERHKKDEFSLPF
ncbi:DNA recombination protein RmuC [Spirochaetota bacterium]|nr:DNA recombination protein RmuC [Spirochaetota bacterium]